MIEAPTRNHSLYSSRPAPVMRRQAPSPGSGNVQFAGVGDAVSRFIGVLDANLMLQLAFMDILGMTAFRTAGEVIGRPPGTKVDAAREVLIRENMGMACNVFVAGWLASSIMAMRSMGKQVGWYNPHGIAPKAWIHARSLEALSNIYHEVLNDPARPVHSVAEAREAFIGRVLSNLVSADPQLQLAAILKAADELDEPAKLQYLQQVAKDYLGAEETARLLAQGESSAPEAGIRKLTEALQGDLSKVGRLREASLARLKQAYALKAPGAAPSALGTNPFSEQAAALVREAREHLAGEAQRLNQPVETLLADFDERKEFAKAYLRLSTQDLAGNHEAFLRRVHDEALSGGLTGTVNLDIKNAKGKPVLQGIKLDQLLKEMKHMLEQYVDRAGHGVDLREPGAKEKIQQALFGEEKTSWWKRWIPRAEEGLVTATRRAKGAYTWIPIWGTVLIGISVGFFNNWLTSRRHGGTMRFPADGPVKKPPGGGRNALPAPAPMAQTFPPPQAPMAAPAMPGVTSPGFQPGLIHRQNGAFARLQAYQNPRGVLRPASEPNSGPASPANQNPRGVLA